MSEKNYLNETVVPRMPKSVSNEQLFVFVPVASGAVAGILKINDTDFYKNRLPELKIIESTTLDSTNKPYYNPLGYVRAGIIKAYVDNADKALKDNIDLKQDKNLSKTIADATTVEGALINLDSSTKDLKTRMTRAEGDINTLKNADEGLANRINNLEQSAYVGETPIGTYPSGATLPTQAQLTAFVQQEVSREPKLGDVVLFTQIVADGTDKSYKFMYTETGWSNYVVSILEKLSNTPGTSDTDGYTQKAVNGIVQNPNLLINPNFAINQRGQTSYTNIGYTVDRWKAYGNGVVITKTNFGISVDNTSGTTFATFRQALEQAEIISQRTVTISCRVKSVQGVVNIYADGLKSAIMYSQELKEGINTLTVDCDVVTRAEIGFNLSQGASIEIEWAKLEIGSVATEFSPPSFAEELLKCQRYYRKYLGGDSGISLVGEFYAASTTAGYSKIYLGNMRSTPTIAISNVADIKIGFSTATFESTAVNKIQYNDITKDMSIYKAYITGTGFVAGQAYFLGIAKDGYIAFDAEI